MRLPEIPDIDRFLVSINSSDELAMVVRSHQCLETALDHLIVDSLPNGHPRIVSRLPFNFKIDLCVALQTVQPDSAPLYALINKIRNSFAHNLEYQIEEQGVVDLYNAAPTDWKKTLAREPDEHVLHWFRRIIARAFGYLLRAIESVEYSKLAMQANSELNEESLGKYLVISDEARARQRALLDAKIEEIKSRNKTLVDNSPLQK